MATNKKLNGKTWLINTGLGVASVTTSMLSAIASAEDTKIDDLNVEVEDDDDRDTAEVIAIIISCAVVGIVLCLVCTYCICSKMRDDQSDPTKIPDKKKFVNDFSLGVSTYANQQTLSNSTGGGKQDFREKRKNLDVEMKDNKGGKSFDASTFERRNQSGSTDNSRTNNLRIDADEAN